MIDMEPILITGVAAAEFIGVGKSLFYQLDASGALPAPVRLHKKRLWSVELLKLWVGNDCPSRDSEQWKRCRRPLQ